MSNLKHVKEALKAVGLRSSDVEISNSNGHVHIRYRGKLVCAAGTPKDPTIAVRRIAKDLRRIM